MSGLVPREKNQSLPIQADVSRDVQLVNVFYNWMWAIDVSPHFPLRWFFCKFNIKKTLFIKIWFLLTKAYSSSFWIWRRVDLKIVLLGQVDVFGRCIVKKRKSRSSDAWPSHYQRLLLAYFLCKLSRRTNHGLISSQWGYDFFLQLYPFCTLCNSAESSHINYWQNQGHLNHYK